MSSELQRIPRRTRSSLPSSRMSDVRIRSLEGQVSRVFQVLASTVPLLLTCSCASVQAGGVAVNSTAPPADVSSSGKEIPTSFFEKAELLEIVPSTVFVTVPSNTGDTTRFELEARLWRKHEDHDWILIPESLGPLPEWEVTESWVHIVKRTAHRVTLEIADHPPLPHEVVVRATVDVAGVPVTAEGQVKIIADNHESTNDKVVAKHLQEGPASVAVVEGQLDTGVDGQCARGNAVAVVRGGLIGDYEWGCEDASGSVSVFSIDHGAVHAEQVWQSGQDSVDLRTDQGALTTLPVKIWVADTVASDSVTQAFRNTWNTQTQVDVWLANRSLRLNRSGIRFSIVGGMPAFTNVDPAHCNERISQAEKGVLNVYYASALLQGRGLFCDPSPTVSQRDWDVVLIDRMEYVPATLLHELGHALGLISPGVGHTNGLTGFRGDNVMWGHELDILAENRNHFSVGQIFRMNFEELSLINRSPAVTDDDPPQVYEGTPARPPNELRLQCQCQQDVGEPCPLLRTDVDEYEFPGEDFGETLCKDVVRVYNTNGEHHGAGLIWGHRWRADLGKCEWLVGVPWRREAHHELSLLFGNLSTDPACDTKQDPPSEKWNLLVFFAKHRMADTEVLRYDPKGTFGFGLGTGDLSGAFNTWSDPPQEPWAVPVNVWHEGAPADFSSNEDIKTADEIFSGEIQEGVYNYSGIQFDWKMSQEGSSWIEDWEQLDQLLGNMGAACPDGGSGNKYIEKGAVNVYYPAKTGARKANLAFLEEHRGWTCTDAFTGTAFIVMSPFDAYSSTSMAHHLGHVFGLGDVNQADGLTPSNLMWNDPMNPMGLDSRFEITLGQVFRLNLHPSSWLNASPLSDRPTDARRVDCSDEQPCPDIALDIRPSQEIP